MINVSEFLFWLGFFWLGYVYAGYPALLWAVGVFGSFNAMVADIQLPKVSVLLSARNEQKDLGWKISETLAWDYPCDKLELLVCSDASEDGTDQILKDVADSRFRYLRLNERKGKNEALNHLNELAQGELLFFSDANSHIEQRTLQSIVRHFSDPRVGCVTGIERTIRENQESGIAAGTRASLGYEAFVNSLESNLGSVLVCDGSLFCIRRSLFTHLQPDLANDFELPMRIGAAGHAILFDSLAVSFERSTSSAMEEFRRKQRICGQGALGFWRLRHLFRGLRAWQFVSRKLLRWLGAIPLALILVSCFGLLSHPFYRIVFGLQLAFYSLALIGWLLAGTRRKATGTTTFPFFFVLVNIGALLGIIKVMAGKRFNVWDSPASSRGFRSDSVQPKEAAPETECNSQEQTGNKSKNLRVEMHPEDHRR
jgi:cellulose synthase/poly-beta-1,6-N-acetylglucosamine synthase-like glycosyltransferase